MPAAPTVNLQADEMYRTGKGKALRVREGQVATFTSADKSHSVTIDTINADSVTFTLRSTPQTFTLKVGQTGTYDVDNDGHPDISVSLASITGGTANMSFAAIAKSAGQTAVTNTTSKNINWIAIIGIAVLFIVGGVAIGAWTLRRGARR
jgi:hypothetical protein